MRELPHERDALVRQAANRSPATARQRPPRRVPQPAARGLDAQPSEVATDPRLEATATDMQAPRPQTSSNGRNSTMRCAMSRVPKAVRTATDAGVSICILLLCLCYGDFVRREPYRQVTQAHDSSCVVRVLTGRSVRRTLRRRVLQLFVLASAESCFCDQPCLDE